MNCTACSAAAIGEVSGWRSLGWTVPMVNVAGDGKVFLSDEASAAALLSLHIIILLKFLLMGDAIVRSVLS